ncbi:MAG: hypothetical protein CNLJKLNK_00587 [Holosporales bacterium]
MTFKRILFFYQMVFYFFFTTLYGAVDVSCITLVGGTGPVGAGFLYYFSNCRDLNVKVIGRKDSVHLKSIQDNGLIIHDAQKEKKILIPQLFDSFHSIEDSSQDFILVTLKQPCFTEEMAHQIKRITKPNGLIAFACNGIPFYFIQSNKIEKNIFNIFKDCKLFHVNPFIAGEKTAPGCLKINSGIDSFFIQFSAVQNTSPDDTQRLINFFQAVKIPLKQNHLNFKELIFEKLKYSLSISALSALEERPLDIIFLGENYESFIHYCIETINKIAEQMGLVSLQSYEDFKKNPLIRNHYSSLYHDIKNNEPNEIESIIGKMIELALKINFESLTKINITPLAKLYDSLNIKSRVALSATTSPLLKSTSRGFW